MLVCSQWVWWWVSVGEGLWGAVAVYILCQYLRGLGNRSVTWGHTLILHGWQSLTPLQPTGMSGCMVARLRIDRPTNSQERTSRSSWCETIIGLSLSVCMSVCLHVCLSVCTIPANVSIWSTIWTGCLPVWLEVWLPDSLVVVLTGCLSVSLEDWLPDSLVVVLTGCLPVCLSGDLSTCQSGCRSDWMPTCLSLWRCVYLSIRMSF